MATTTKKAPKKASTSSARKNRRTSFELLQGLESKLRDMEYSYSSRVAKLQARIDTLRQRHASRLAEQEIRATKSPDEINDEIIQLKAKLAAFRRASKAR